MKILQESDLIFVKDSDAKDKPIEYYENFKDRFNESETSGKIDEKISKEFVVKR